MSDRLIALDDPARHTIARMLTELSFTTVQATFFPQLPDEDPSMFAVRRTGLLCTTAVIAALAGPMPGAASAQSAQKVSLQLSGLYVGVFGDAYDGLKGGPGAELQLRYTPGAWSFGAGTQASLHDFTDAELSDQQVLLTGAFFEPRRVIDIGSSSVAPYLSARFAWLRQTLNMTLTDGIDEVDVEATASGGQINGGGGLLFRMSPRVNLDIGATFGVIRFGDVEINAGNYGQGTVQGTTGTGQNVVFRLGLAIGLGH